MSWEVAVGKSLHYVEDSLDDHHDHNLAAAAVVADMSEVVVVSLSSQERARLVVVVVGVDSIDFLYVAVVDRPDQDVAVGVVRIAVLVVVEDMMAVDVGFVEVDKKADAVWGRRKWLVVL